MENKTIYTHDLQLKIQLFHMAKAKRRVQTIALTYFVLGVALILYSAFGNAHMVTLPYLSGVIIAYSLFASLSLFRNRKSKIGKSIEKEMRENPDKVLEYKFEEDHVTAICTSKYIKSETSIKYDYISTVTKIDEKSFYFQTKNNFTYFLYDENGISELFSHLLYKTNK